MRLLRGAFIVALLMTSAAPAEAGGKRPPLVVAVDKGDQRSLARLLKKAKPKDLDAFDDKSGSPTAGLRAIEVAARKGDAAAVAALLGAGATATAKALEYAAERGDAASVQALLERKAPRADLALTAAAKAGKADVVTLLLPAARTADPYFNVDQVLELAIYFPAAPSADVVKLLVDAGAKTSIQWGPGQQTVLHLAVAKGALDVADVLLAAGAPVDAEDGDGTTPLLSAVRGARFAIAGRLLDAGADPRRVNRRGEHVLGALTALDPAAADVAGLFDRLVKAGVPVDHAGKDGVTALMVAAGAGKKAWVDKLIGRGASTAARSSDGRLAIDVALSCAVGSGTWAPPTVTACHGDVALALLARPKAPLGAVDRFERAPLHRAAMTGNAELVARVIALGGGAAALDQWGNSALHYAARFGSPAMIATLAAVPALRGALDGPNDRDETPLAIARAAGRADVEKALLSAGATK